MKHFTLKSFVCAVMVAALPLTFSCRTKSKTMPQTTPPVTDTVGAVETPTPTPMPVEQPRDFVQEQPTEEMIPSNLDDLNRMAQDRGWIRDAFFNYDEAGLSTDAQEALTESATWLKAHAAYNLQVEGHCDSRGTEQYNLALGDRRANTAKDYLITLGVDGSRITTISYGEERPFDTGTSEAAYAKNRRAHLVLTGR
ncbi:MAG: peptidoglycan-associated lipoprotein Pal [Acidobacteriota bacterium]